MQAEGHEEHRRAHDHRRGTAAYWLKKKIQAACVVPRCATVSANYSQVCSPMVVVIRNPSCSIAVLDRAGARYADG